MVIYLWIMAVGYLTFGTAAEGLILNNYSEKAGTGTKILDAENVGNLEDRDDDE